MKPLYDFPSYIQDKFIEGHLNHGKIISRAEGSFGDVFFLGDSGQRFSAKCPRISRFGNPEEARKAVEKAIYEIENTQKYRRYPGVQGFAPPKLVLGWPFFLSQMRDGTLSDLIAEPSGWHQLQKLATLIQIAHALNYCRSLGLVAHQDLKPDNIFVQRLRRNQLPDMDPEDVIGFTTITYISDFGIADAFRNIGQNSGSRPYMAPEQYGKSLLVDGSKIDVFALGVIIFECFADGLHPVGERTSEIWPNSPGTSSKWKHEDAWKKWARQSKSLGAIIRVIDIPERLAKLVNSCLEVDPGLRPDMEEVENELWLSLQESSPDWARGVRTQIDDFDSIAPPNETIEWPYMDKRIDDLKKFYAQMT